jgi:hypothetical protein
LNLVVHFFHKSPNVNMDILLFICTKQEQ